MVACFDWNIFILIDSFPKVQLILFKNWDKNQCQKMPKACFEKA